MSTSPRFNGGMPALTRRRDPEARTESWQVYFGDVRIGWIGERAGVPKSGDQWGWTCGFHPRDRHLSGTAGSFDQARVDFELAWHDYLPRCSPEDFDAWRYQAGCDGVEVSHVGHRLQDADPDAGAAVEVLLWRRHRLGYDGPARLRNSHGSMKYAEPRPYADPEKAARRIIEIGSTVEPVQDGRIFVELVNGPFLYNDKGSPAEYGAGLKLALERGWLSMHESGTYLKFTPAGAELFA